jgi:6-phosphofructokinase
MRPFGLAPELKTIIPTIEIANGGGDYPGLNVAVPGFGKRTILRYGWRVIGIGDGL